MKLYTYIVVTDDGFAPNPFHGICTLACCKPVIRRVCREGDWIAGLTPKARGHRLVYAMKVEKKLSFTEYWNSSAFACKRVDMASAQGRCGDNIYEPLPGNNWKQHPSLHSDTPFGNVESEATKKHDLSGNFVLLAREFTYHGAAAIPLPAKLASDLAAGRGHRSKFDDHVLQQWKAFMAEQPHGLQCEPVYAPTGCGCVASCACSPSKH